MTDKEKIRAKIEQLMYGFNLEADIASCEDAETEKLADIKYQLCKKILEYIDSLQEEPKQKFKIGDRIKFKGVYDEDVVRTITDIQKYDDGSCRYIFADGSLHSVGNNEIIDDTLNLSNVQRTVKNWKEPVSEDLEEAADMYSNNDYNYSDVLVTEYDGTEHWMDDKGFIKDAFKAGAKWRAEQFEKNRLKHCDALTEEQAQIESDFVTQHLKENGRTPTFIDAIEYGKDLQKHQMIKGAVEAKVYNKAYPTEFEIETNTFMQKLKHGDKVKVLVIKED